MGFCFYSEAEFVTRNDDKPSLSPIGNFSPMEEAYLCKCGLGDEVRIQLLLRFGKSIWNHQYYPY